MESTIYKAMIQIYAWIAAFLLCSRNCWSYRKNFLHSRPFRVLTDRRLTSYSFDAVHSDAPVSATNQNEINRRRNFAIISHPDAGKTTLTEKLLLLEALLGWEQSNRRDQKDTTSDFMAIRDGEELGLQLF